MQTEGERISNVISYFCKSKAEFARQMEETPQVISNWVARGAGKGVLSKILSKFPSINANWLLTGEGEMISNNNLKTNVVPAHDTEGEFFVENSNGAKFFDLGNGRYKMNVPLVPFCAYARFANEVDTLEPDKEGWEAESFEVPQIVHGKYLSFEIKGDSMDNGTRESFEDGDKVLVRELDRIHWKDGLRYNKSPYWVIVFDSSVLIKQIIDQDINSGEITCHSLNNSPQYTDFKLKLDEIRKLYYVVQRKPRVVNY